MNQRTQRKIFWCVIIGIMIIILSAIRIKEIFFTEKDNVEGETQIEEVMDEVVDRSIILYSDSAIDSKETQLKNERLTTLFENSNYKYKEKVTQYGMLSSLNSTFSYTEKEVKSTEYLVISAGFVDMAAETEIGDFDTSDITTMGYLKKRVDNVIELSPDTKIIFLGIPCYDLSTVNVEYKYSIQDYNLAFEFLANNYDNIYYIDLYEKTQDEPLTIQTDKYKYDFKTIQLIYDELTKLIEEIELK